MTDKKKADLILDKLDTLAATMDDMSAAIDDFQRRLEVVDGHLLDVKDELNRVTERQDEQREQVRELESSVENTTCDLRDIRENLENLGKIFPDIENIADDMRRRERNEMLFDARAAMGKVAFVRMK